MPELPEVETVRRGLELTMLGRRVDQIKLNRPNLRFPLDPDIPVRLAGASVTALDRRGKYLLMRLRRAGEDFILLCHLGMSGRFRIVPPKKTEQPEDTGQRRDAQQQEFSRQKHDHVEFWLEGGAFVVYNDARRFGFMQLIDGSDADVSPFISKLGPEPVIDGENAALTSDYFYEALSSRRGEIKTLLLDQAIVAGVGNIYACEALHSEGISPLLTGVDLARTPDRIDGLIVQLGETMSRAIAAGGSTLRDHARPNGDSGYFQHEFRVYDREGEKCQRSDCDGVIIKIRQGGRSTFYCPDCQL